MAEKLCITQDDLKAALNMAVAYLNTKVISVVVNEPVAPLPGSPANNGAEALVNVRTYNYPLLGTPQYTDEAGRKASDDRWAFAQARPELANVPKDTLEIVSRGNTGEITFPDHFVTFSFDPWLNGLSSDAWVAKKKEQSGGPSGQ